MSETSRRADAPVSPLFTERWSRRAFTDQPVDRAAIARLFEAARWAPSCFNEQPWRFVWATQPEDLERLRGLLNASNQVWANQAPVLAFLITTRHFAKNGQENAWAELDAGSAWMSLALEAHLQGLTTHAMAGFDADRAYEVLGVPRDRYRVMCGIAIGHPGDPAALPEPLQSREAPNGRRPQSETAFEGRFPAPAQEGAP